MRRINLTESRLNKIINEEIRLCEATKPKSQFDGKKSKELKLLLDRYSMVYEIGKDITGRPYSEEEKEMAKRYAEEIHDILVERERKAQRKREREASGNTDKRMGKAEKAVMNAYSLNLFGNEPSEEERLAAKKELADIVSKRKKK